MRNPIKMDDLGGKPIFLETPMYEYVVVFVDFYFSSMHQRFFKPNSTWQFCDRDLF